MLRVPVQKNGARSSVPRGTIGCAAVKNKKYKIKK
jgi:hypothetical protein